MALVTTPIATTIIGCAIKVHRELGPGLFESIYGPCLSIEMTKAGLAFRDEVILPVTYGGVTFKRAFRADFIVENEVLVELKSVEAFAPVHATQVLTYMRLAKLRKGLLFNFKVSVLKEGIRSFVL